MAGKGDRHRSISKEFKDGYDNIQWDKNKVSRFERKKERAVNKSARVWSDIQPYQAVGGDVAGKYITSRSHHREFLKRNNCIEVGNEKDYFFKHKGKTPDNPTRDW